MLALSLLIIFPSCLIYITTGYVKGNISHLAMIAWLVCAIAGETVALYYIIQSVEKTISQAIQQM